MNNELEELLLFAQSEGKVCPQPQEWDALWKLLPERKRQGGGWEPPAPLILGAWWHSSDEEKRSRFLSHIEWANNHGALTPVAEFIKALRSDQWHYVG